MSGPRQKPYDKKHKERKQEAEQKLANILKNIEVYGLSARYVSKLGVGKAGDEFWRRVPRSLLWWSGSVAVALLTFWLYYAYLTSECVVSMPFDKALFREPEDCSMCRDVSGVLRLHNVSADTFERELAYSPTPLVVTGAVPPRAEEVFSFEFFKRFYARRRSALGRRTGDCFFFSYQSGLRSLQDVFDMDSERANLTAGTRPWYVGWNTCYDRESRELRALHPRPHFLPASAESDAVDWIFMGGPGQGAHMHVDSVKHMSWQAQLRGSKEWVLAPPPECLYSCQWITFVVRPGEILVVDTNRWYHKTRVLPGDLSITIGAEYD